MDVTAFILSAYTAWGVPQHHIPDGPLLPTSCADMPDKLAMLSPNPAHSSDLGRLH